MNYTCLFWDDPFSERFLLLKVKEVLLWNSHDKILSFDAPSLVAQMVKHLPMMRETRLRSLGREDPLEKEMATHSSTLAWKILWIEEPGGLQTLGLQRVGHNWASLLHWPTTIDSHYILLRWEIPAQFSSVQSLSRVQLFVTLRTAARQASLSITNSWSLLKLVSIESVMPSNHLILYSPLLFPPFPASGSFQMSQLLASGGQGIGVSASTSVLPMNIQDWFPWGSTGWISLQIQHRRA